MTNKVGYEFYVIMLKRQDGEVYADLHKTDMKIYLDYEDAVKGLESLEICREHLHIVKMVAYLNDD